MRRCDVVALILGEAEDEHRSFSMAVGDQSPPAAALAFAWSRHALLDQAATEIGINEASFGPSDSVNELKSRGINDILIAVVDGLKGFPEAITSVFPQSIVQTCIVHLIRNSLAFVSWKDRKAILPANRAIYRAENADMARVQLEEFEAEWGKRYPAIGQVWRRAW